MRLPSSEYLNRPWRLHEVAPDFEVEDVWELPTPGGPDDLDRLVQGFAQGGGASNGGIVGFLMAVRWKLGAWFGWDAPGKGIGTRVQSLRERLPGDLAAGSRGPDSTTLPFTSVFQTHDEWAAEIANGTMHGVVHIGWVSGSDGVYRAQMTVLVQPNGRAGRVYMAFITPFRRMIVYPRMLRSIGRRWAATPL